MINKPISSLAVILLSIHCIGITAIAFDIHPLTSITKKAEQGDLDSQFDLGWRYHKGKGVKKDDSKAFALWTAAANKGHAAAQHNLALLYFNGLGVEKNAIEAVNWFRKAAEAGFPQAQRNLGFCYRSGSGLKQDNSEAFKWFRESALRRWFENHQKCPVCRGRVI